MKKNLVIYVMIGLAFLLSCAAIAGGAYFRAGVETFTLYIGQPSDRMVLAPREVPDFYTTEANRQAAYDAAATRELNHPIRTRDETVWVAVAHVIDMRFDELSIIRDAYTLEREVIENNRTEWYAAIQALQAERLREQEEWDILRTVHLATGGYEEELPPRPYDFEITPDLEWVEPAPAMLSMFWDMPIFFTEAQQMYLLNIPHPALTELWETTWETAQVIQAGAIHEWEETGALERVLNAIRHYLDDNVPDAMTRDIVFEIVSRSVRPNHFIDQEATERRRLEDEDNFVRVTVQAGERIISEGDLVTERAYRILEYLGYIGNETDWRDEFRQAIIPLSGMFLLTAALFVGVVMYLSFYRPTIISMRKEAALIFVLYTLVLVLIWVLREQPYHFLPVLIFPMLVSVLIDRRCAIMLSVSVVMVGFFIVEGSLAYLLFFSISSILLCLLSRFTTQRSNIILVGILVTAIQFALSLAVTFTLERSFALDNMQLHLTSAGFAAVNGLLTVIICMGSLPFWEAIFGVVTPIKLLDLTNPTNLLLRRLTIEAPGTYHHSLMVANLAESAAYDIGANAHAARVGGYYHDVGKLKFPHFFAENINGENPHEYLEPINSAGLIVSHISYGLTLAAQHRLPQFVRDIIREHHGTTLMQFFYVKAKEADPSATEEDYRYPYNIPKTRESACVMLADTVEAAVRSMMPKMKSTDEVEKAIRDLVRHKLNDGQLADSDLSIKDLDTIIESFARVLKSAHHERIAYPKIEPEVVDPRDPPLIRGLVRKD
ncbi:MAG: HDIG domain-containing protein [Defluviitaleaceae bacterium]|nr:HDIG domain-containing protein [Defluviitaleaceae bacterium]